MHRERMIELESRELHQGDRRRHLLRNMSLLLHGGSEKSA